jgi:hypothetical protein
MSTLDSSVNTFRNRFTYSNSPSAIARFPFPFPEDEYRYSVNTEPHTGGPIGSCYEHTFDVDEHYAAECLERSLVLSQDPRRCVALPHMMSAQWDTLELIMECFSRDYPNLFTLRRDGSHWTWTNRPLGRHDSFVFGDAATLPYQPLEYITRQAQGDFVVLDQRDGDLYADAGMVTGPADWSMTFDAGMSFKEWHAPVPLAHEAGVFDRALKLLLTLRLGAPIRRLNWTCTVHPRLDTSPELFHEWRTDRTLLTPDTIGRNLHLRVELQALFRLPRSNGILFSIRTYLISFGDLISNHSWAGRTHSVLLSLPPQLVEYKGLSRYREMAIEWLEKTMK